MYPERYDPVLFLVEYDTSEVLARHQQKQHDKPEASTSDDLQRKTRKTSMTDGDVDHALGESQRAISIKGGKHANGTKGDTKQEGKKKIEIEWTPELEEMSREKAEAEARTGALVHDESPVQLILTVVSIEKEAQVICVIRSRYQATAGGSIRYLRVSRDG